jgi:secreted trypsin-like serine protease
MKCFRMILFGCLLSNSLCTNHEPKVVGGTEVTDRSNFPYQAYLLYIDTIPYCGATIITERHVLTAAHCCFPTASLAQPSEISVVTGNLELNDRSNVKQVENVMVHENYDRYSLYNDIAIIKVSRLIYKLSRRPKIEKNTIDFRNFSTLDKQYTANSFEHR